LRRSQRNVVQLNIPSTLGWERVAMDLAESVARRMGFPLDRVEDIKTAVSEATLNAIEHGNGLDASQEVVIILAPEAERLEIYVKDHSSLPMPVQVGQGTEPAPSVEEKLEHGARQRGWGVHLIRSLMDEVDFRSTGRGNVVRMVIRLSPPGA